jgi:hypothetical protein
MWCITCVNCHLTLFFPRGDALLSANQQYPQQ